MTRYVRPHSSYKGCRGACAGVSCSTQGCLELGVLGCMRRVIHRGVLGVLTCMRTGVIYTYIYIYRARRMNNVEISCTSLRQRAYIYIYIYVYVYKCTVCDDRTEYAERNTAQWSYYKQCYALPRLDVHASPLTRTTLHSWRTTYIKRLLCHNCPLTVRFLHFLLLRLPMLLLVLVLLFLRSPPPTMASMFPASHCARRM